MVKAMYTKIKDGKVTTYPYTPSSLRAENTNISFPSVMTDAMLAGFGVFPVASTPKPSASWDERVEEIFPALQGGVWTQAWQIVPLSTEQRTAFIASTKAARLAALAAKRWEKETGGITVNGAAVATDETSQTKLIGAVVGSQIDPTAIMKWKMKDGAFVTLDAATITAVAMAVRSHIQACFDREAELKAQIDGTTNPDAVNAIDIESGWPA